MKILVIDDCEADLELIRIYLNRAGFTDLLLAGSAEKGILLAREHRPPVVLTDTNLPCMTGYEICREIKKIDGYKPWVILMTGAVDGRDEQALKDAGLDDYCEKTFEVDNIIETLRRAPSN